jgi:hypothetical protein
VERSEIEKWKGEKFGELSCDIDPSLSRYPWNKFEKNEFWGVKKAEFYCEKVNEKLFWDVDGVFGGERRRRCNKVEESAQKLWWMFGFFVEN